MGSLSSFSLLQPKTPITQITTHNLCFNSLKPQFLNPQHIKDPPFPLLKFMSSHSNPLKLSPKLSNVCSALKPHKLLPTILVEKIVGLVVGTVLFVGCFNVRAAVALPAQTSSSSETLEEKRETQKGKSEEEEMYERILEEDPRNVEALKVVVYGKMRRGETKEAVKYVEKLISVEPDEVEWRLLLALCQEIMGELGTAKKLFQEILEERPLLLRALHGLALVMHKKREGPAVFVMLDKALKIAQREKRVIEERNIRILIAQMHVVKGQLEEGLNLFQDLVNEDPRDFRPYLCQGIIYSLLDQKKEAGEQFEIYRALVPEEVSQRGFLDDVVLAAKMKPGEQLQKEFDAEFSIQK
ncbi:protein SLOW GREEN 1, chloroplastic [Argentina anserina]|uniref:protein SLOW GREEN 1, chloroplastic n=1 Tax=Argentina anserina TaxID=57926 RepID=UPI0021768452|nr:protein SLOW GREEN 1, chloroplastic [Potentilla anserina]